MAEKTQEKERTEPVRPPDEAETARERSERAQAKAKPRRPVGDLQRRTASELVTDAGKTSIADAVVAKVASVATKEISGVHDLGRGVARALGAVREFVPGGDGGSSDRGVKVEVGKRQAAIDLDIVVDYGVSIPDLSSGVRDNVIDRVENICGLEVKEVNIFIDDIWLGEESPEPRVE